MKKVLKKIPVLSHPKTALMAKSAYWFFVGVILGLFFLLSFTFILFQQIYKNAVFPGISIDGTNFGGKSQLFIQNYFDNKNKQIGTTTFTFYIDNYTATASAQDLQAGYDSKLLAQQAMSIGRSSDVLSNISLVFQAYLNGISLSPSYTFSQDALTTILKPITDTINTAPVDALFQFKNGRATTFKPSSDGQAVDMPHLATSLTQQIQLLLTAKKTEDLTISIPKKILHPTIATADANGLGIKELIGYGTSLFQGSIASRIYNVELAASRLNGVIVKPGEEFSFGRSLGDVSAYTGYKQAYVISGGHTVLGDGGGVCQVSTTLFRAILNAGLPVTERHAHDYRVEYYEEDGPPGIDATVYVPTVDLKFKNDTGNSILIQSVVDPIQLRLTFYLYGTKDGRKVTMTTPVVTNQTPAPPSLYQDDPTLPKGVTKQIDFAAAGATVTFSRTVTKNDKPYIQETYVSNYRPWQAVYLVGTGG